ncbi:hypothetical protein BDV3_000863 [Batrachochytrium dendrobatidis]|nr:hypothetical protein O5D80_000265 [Batrachochytrium dendrobatidis]KAK5671782.1 hypothetical protein QVD99_001617 [Batrachochytrium dendrobatidis]
MIVPIALFLAIGSLVSGSFAATKPKCHHKGGVPVAEPVHKPPAPFKTKQPLPGPARMRPYHNDSRPSEHSICHWYDPTRGNNSIIVAGMKLTASVPSVNLENSHGLESIKCQGDKVFASYQTLKEAQSWTVEPTLLIISALHKCGPNNTAEFVMLLAQSWTIVVETKTIVFTTVDPQTAGVTGNYEVIALPAVESRQHDFIAPTTEEPRRIYKRDMSESELEHHELVKRIFHFDNSYHLPLNIDIGISTVVDLPLGKVGTLTTGCDPCGIYGQSVATFHAFGGLFETPGVSLNWEGHVQLTANMLFRLKANVNVEQSEVTLVELPITPINIPGFLVVGPELMLNGRADVAILADIDVHANFTAALPHFRAFLSSSDPKNITGFVPVYSLRTDAHVEIDANIKVALIPKLALVAKIFGKDLLHTSLSLDNTADLKIGLHAKTNKTITSTDGKPLDPRISGDASANGCITLSVGTTLIGELFTIKKDLITIAPKKIIDKCFNVNSPNLTIATKGPRKTASAPKPKETSVTLTKRSNHLSIKKRSRTFPKTVITS